MNSDVRYQIFLSSTYEDLREERQQATQAILEMDHMPAGMELFPASDLSQWELIKTVIGDSDYYIVIVSARYGTIHKETGLSFTEMEYDYAVAMNIPILGFARKNINDVRLGMTEADPISKAKLELFREKVKSRTCRQFDEPTELGLHVMKSLTSETRINPRTGWVRADQARGKEDIEREQALIDEISKKEKVIRKLDRQMRDRIVPLTGVSLSELSQGSDIYELAVVYQDAHKKAVSEDIALTWDEIYSVISPSMYGYILRRAAPSYPRPIGSYTFEPHLIEYVRTKFISRCGRRAIDILPHQVDEILIQFKQLGLIAMVQHYEEDDGKSFRGYSLTEAGEEYMTRMKIKRRNTSMAK